MTRFSPFEHSLWYAIAPPPVTHSLASLVQADVCVVSAGIFTSVNMTPGDTRSRPCLPMTWRGQDPSYTHQVMSCRLKWLHPQIKSSPGRDSLVR